MHLNDNQMPSMQYLEYNLIDLGVTQLEMKE
jgi:hypothetical protein